MNWDGGRWNVNKETDLSDLVKKGSTAYEDWWIVEVRAKEESGETTTGWGSDYCTDSDPCCEHGCTE